MARPVVIDDSDSDTWAHGLFTYDKEIGEFGFAEFKLLDRGPIRGGLRVTTRYGRSVLVQDYYIYLGEKELEVHIQKTIYPMWFAE